MNMYRFYLGSAHKYFPQWGGTMEGVAHDTLTKYGITGYTVFRAKGLWEGELEDVLVYDIFTGSPRNLIKTIVNEIIEMTGETAILLTEFQAVTHFCPCPYANEDIPNSLKF